MDAASGKSMLPLVRAGLDTIVVAPCSAADLAPMDVVIYERPGAGAGAEYVLHRVVSRKGPGIVALGDSCTWLEEIPAAQVRVALLRACRRLRCDAGGGVRGRGAPV